MQTELVEEFIIHDLEVLKALAHPLRLDILRQFKQPNTVKEAAAVLDIVPTKLYYHINQLEQHGLLQVVNTNIVSGIIEKTYQVTARRFRVDEKLLSGPAATEDNFDVLIGTILDSTRREIRASFRAGLIDLSETEAASSGILRVHYQLTAVAAQSLHQELETLLKKYDHLSAARRDDAPDTAVYGLTTLFYPVAPSHHHSTDVDKSIK